MSEMPPPAAAPGVTKTCCSPIILAILGLLALGALAAAIILALNYHPSEAKPIEKVSQAAGIVQPDSFTVI